MAIGFVATWLCVFAAVTSATRTTAPPRFPYSSSVEYSRQEEGSVSTKPNPYETNYFTQQLDHFSFNPTSYQTFQQRYLISPKHWGGAAGNYPIFVYTGNEGKIDWFAANTGFMSDNAPKFKALLVFIEHRFYGESVPFGGKAIAYKNSSTLGYLSSTQALADYATLILDLKHNLSAPNSPVVVFGGSYGGMLAAWFRLKYPHIAIGALASSSPILYFDNMTSPYSFYDTVMQNFKSESKNCYNEIKKTWSLIEETAEEPGKLEMLRKSFGICKNYITGDSLENWLSRAFIYTAMTDYPTPSNFMNPMPAYPVRQMCKQIDDDAKYGPDTFAKMKAAASIFYNYTGKATCFNLDDNSDPHDLGGWQWQACTEMVMPLAIRANSMLPSYEWNYERRANFCRSNYGVTPRPHWITAEFGGHNIKRILKRFASNIIFFNGLRDPWSGGGVLKNISNSIIAIVAKEGAHHVDLRLSTSDDPQWLRDVRKQEIVIIQDWLSQYYYDLAHLGLR